MAVNKIIINKRPKQGLSQSHAVMPCDYSIRVTAILEYIESVVPPLCNIENAHCAHAIKTDMIDVSFERLIPQIKSEELQIKLLPRPFSKLFNCHMQNALEVPYHGMYALIYALACPICIRAGTKVRKLCNLRRFYDL